MSKQNIIDVSNEDDTQWKKNPQQETTLNDINWLSKPDKQDQADWPDQSDQLDQPDQLDQQSHPYQPD